MTEKPRTLKECEADFEAWADILLQINYDNPEEAEAIFLTRCAESAQEALAEGEKRRAALEKLRNHVFREHSNELYGNLLHMPYCTTCQILNELDALAPAPKENPKPSDSAIE